MGKKDPNYQQEHCELYREHNLAWPPRFPDIEDIDFAGLCRRSAELLVLLHHIFPPKEDGFSFIDTNASTKRFFSNVNPDGSVKDPWRPHPFTITSQTQLIVRRKSGQSVSLRRVSTVELFALIGWCYEHWADCSGIALDEAKASSLVGNAFSGYRVGPVLLAVFAAPFVAGWFCTEPTEELDDKSDDQSDASSIPS